MLAITLLSVRLLSCSSGRTSRLRLLIYYKSTRKKGYSLLLLLVVFLVVVAIAVVIAVAVAAAAATS